MKKVFIIFGIILAIFYLPHISIGAGASGYTPLAPIPGLTDGTTLGTNSTQASPGFSAYLRQLYTWVVAAASGLAVVMIMWGGVEYMTSAGGGGVEEAKKRISASIMGLLLALGSYIILATVNKDLLNLNFNLGTISVMQEGFTPFSSNAVDKVVQPQFSNSSDAQVNASRGAIGGEVDNQPNIPRSSSPDTSGSLGSDMNGSLALPDSIAPLDNTGSSAPASSDEGAHLLLPPLKLNE